MAGAVDKLRQVDVRARGPGGVATHSAAPRGELREVGVEGGACARAAMGGTLQRTKPVDVTSPAAQPPALLAQLFS